MKNRIYCILISVLVHLNSIMEAQNIGIGTSTPLEKLHVEGNILMDTAKVNAILLAPNAGSGKILTSDDSGNATWENLVLPPPSNNSNGNIGYGVWGDCATNGNISAYQPVTDISPVANRIFGCSVSVSGNVALIGSYQDNVGIPFQGSASVFVYNGTSWEFFQKLTDPEAGAADYFGFSVSISGDNIIIGSLSDDATFNNQGSVCFFHFNGVSWDFVEKIYQVGANVSNGFGASVFMSGDRAIVGAPNNNASEGAASFYQFDGTNWQFINQVAETFGSPHDNFGSSVGIFGDLAIIGVPGDDIDGIKDVGSAIVYQFNGTNWILIEKITTGSEGAAFDHFGSTVAISANNILVGAPYTNLSYTDQGRAYMFRFNGTNWILLQTFTDIHPTLNAGFGASVYLSGTYAIIGTPQDIQPGSGYIHEGSADIYQKIGFYWQHLQTVFDPATDYNNFGAQVAMDGVTRHFLIAAPGYGFNSGKAVFGKIN